MSEDKKPASSSIVPFGGDIFQTSLRDRPWGRTVPWHRPRNPFSSHSLPARWKPPAGYWWLLRSVQLPIFKFWRKTDTDKSITQIEVAKILRKVLLHQRYRGRSVFGKILRQWTVKNEGLWMISETNHLEAYSVCVAAIIQFQITMLRRFHLYKKLESILALANNGSLSPLNQI